MASNKVLGVLASEITSDSIVFLIVYAGTCQRKHQRSASLVFVRENLPVTDGFPLKGPVTRKMFSFNDVIMNNRHPFIDTWRRLTISYCAGGG